MIFALPNPTKTISAPVNVNKTRKSIKDLSNVLTTLGHDGYILQNSDDFLGVYQFGKMETLSLGVNITLTVSGSESQSQIHIEVSRVLGTFDKWYEITNANFHIDHIVKCLSILLDPNFEQRFNDEIKKKEEFDSYKFHPVVNFLIISGVLLWIGYLMF